MICCLWPWACHSCSLSLSFLICKIRDPWKSDNVCARVLYSIKGHSDVNYHLIQPPKWEINRMSPGISFGLCHYGCFLSESKHWECTSFECEFVIHPPPASLPAAGWLSLTFSARAETSPSVRGSTCHPSFNEDKKKILWVKSIRAPSWERAGAGLRRPWDSDWGLQ